jgi:predicted phage terminase large subunit-like protein
MTNSALALKSATLALLEKKVFARCRENLNAYCQYIEIPGAPMVADSCKLGDDCDDPTCTGHEISNSFYPTKVKPAKHHRLINNTLQKVGDREICPITGNRYDNVMIFMPPGSAKSTYGSVCFPTWYMGKYPNKNIITTSYASQLAKKFGRKCRSIAQSKEFNDVFNTTLNTTNRAVDDWSLENGATFMSGGILSGITGNRADGLLIDDPVKGKEDAESPVIREKTWDAYLSDLRSRVKPGGWKLIIQTRWHENDLSGRILPEQWDGQSGWVESRQGDMWYVICLQAECERDDDPLGREIGEWLWLDWFNELYWQAEKRNQGSRNWGALYQQRPKPAEGSIFKKAWFKRYGTPPAKFLRVVFSLDTAYKEQEINDPSVIELWGETESNDHYLLYVWKGKVEYPQLKRVVANHYMQHASSGMLIEDKASGQSLIQECRQGITLEGYPKKINIPTIAIEPDGSKLIRAERVSSTVEAGQVYLPEVAPWLTDFESEIFGFPLSTNDDQVDAMSQYLEWATGKSNLHFISHGQQRKALDGERPQAALTQRTKRDKYAGY